MNLKNKIFTFVLVIIVLLSVSNVLGVDLGGSCFCGCVGPFSDSTPVMSGCICGYTEILMSDNCPVSCTCKCFATTPDSDPDYCNNCATDTTFGDGGIKYSNNYFDHPSNSGTVRCCGDDSNEWLWGNACCDQASDCEYSGVCYNYGATRNSGAYICDGNNNWFENTVDADASSGACICASVCKSNNKLYRCIDGTNDYEWIVVDEACTITNMGEPSCLGSDCYCPSCTSNQCQIGTECYYGWEITSQITCENTCGGEWIYMDVGGNIQLGCCYGDSRYPYSAQSDGTVTIVQTDDSCSSKGLRYW